MPVISENKKACFNYEILERFEAGVVLNGQEVKSLKTNGVNLAGSYAVLKDEELFWIGANIPPYQPRNIGSSYDPERSRKLLLKKIGNQISDRQNSSKRIDINALKSIYYKRKNKAGICDC